LDYRNRVWGRWRPSAAAVRLGPLCVRLEELLYRDGHSLREAIEVLRSAGVRAPDKELTRLTSNIPLRVSTVEVPLDRLEVPRGRRENESEDPPARSSDDDERVVAALREAVQQLPSDDQLITKMRYWSDASIADISRAMRLEQKPLYRRLKSIERRLRDQLAARGIDRARALEVLRGEAVW
jgi:RNA polymerase sigma factor for flagellar operon FliA